MYTSRDKPFETRCNLVSYTTEGALGGNEGVKMPSTAATETTEVFISSEPAGLKEYTVSESKTEP